MNISPRKFLPAARCEEIITREVEGELLVYDQLRDKAHCLNASAAAIWKRCDGHSTVADIAQSLALESDGVADEDLVALGLDELGRRHLLTDVVPPQTAKTNFLLSRREAVRRIGLGAAIALPIVITITAPTAAEAGSCKPGGASCGTGSQCCSGTCSGGSCLGGIVNPQERSRRRS